MPLGVLAGPTDSGAGGGVEPRLFYFPRHKNCGERKVDSRSIFGATLNKCLSRCRDGARASVDVE